MTSRRRSSLGRAVLFRRGLGVASAAGLTLLLAGRVDQALRPLAAEVFGASVAASAECLNWRSEHPEWIFCDDFETLDPLVGPGRYFEYGDDEGDFVPSDEVGFDGSRGMRTVWQPGEVGAGGMKLSFGRNPNRYMRRGIRPDEDFRELYYRMYMRLQPGWEGNPAKLSRATIFTSSSDWSQAMIAHLWGDRADHLGVDPVRCVDERNQVRCSGYNDFDSMEWLGFRSGQTSVFGPDTVGNWLCIEAHVRLNDPGQTDGVQEFWIDERLEARNEGLDFVRSYTEYGLNAVFFENYWNDGAPREQRRYFDNIVVSEGPIGCLSPLHRLHIPLVDAN